MSNGFNIDNYTAEDLANASAQDLDYIVEQFDLDPSKYGKYFAKFDQTQIDNIVKNFENQIGSLNLNTRNKLNEFKGEVGKGYSTIREFTRKSGFEGSGGPTDIFKQQQKTIFGKQGDILTAKGLQEDKYGLEAEMAKGDAYRDYHERFMTQLTNVEQQIQQDEMMAMQNQGASWGYGDWMGTPDDDKFNYADVTPWNDEAGFLGFIGGSGGSDKCVVSSALNTSGVWSDSEKRDAVNWCKENHHDGSERGKTWVKGYHTWGKFLSKWVEKSKIVRWVVDTTTTAFIDHTRRNKKNYLGWMIHNLWINPLSYVIGYSKKNKILGKIATFGMIGLYTLLFPLFAIVSIPHVIKDKYGSSI